MRRKTDSIREEMNSIESHISKGLNTTVIAKILYWDLQTISKYIKHGG